jgi:hypothetical protein
MPTGVSGILLMIMLDYLPTKHATRTADPEEDHSRAACSSIPEVGFDGVAFVVVDRPGVKVFIYTLDRA